jgi:hypothetical protein
LQKNKYHASDCPDHGKEIPNLGLKSIFSAVEIEILKPILGGIYKKNKIKERSYLR